MKELPLDYLRECLDYDALTGVFYWKNRPRNHFLTDRACSITNARCAGRIAGSLDKLNGYVAIGISRNGIWRLYQAHRLAIALSDGAWPNQPVDHINRVKSDNRRANLRVCSHEENMRNQGRKSGASSAMKGAYFNQRIGKWQSSICVKYKQIHLGYFATAILAHSAYTQASARYHGAFGNVG